MLNVRIIRSKLRRFRDARRGWFLQGKEKVYFPPESIIYDIYHEQGSFEPHVQYLLGRLARPDTFVFDVGANIGLMALETLSRCTGVKVISLEPSPKAFACLSKTRDATEARGRWTVLNKAASESAGSMEFYEHFGGKDAYNGFQNTGRGGPSRVITVATQRLDDIWSDLGNPEVSAIKVDVEGAELSVIRGAVRCIEKSRPSIIIEWWPQNFRVYGAKSGDLLEFATAHNYRLFEITTLIEIIDVCALDLCHVAAREDFVMVPNEFRFTSS